MFNMSIQPEKIVDFTVENNVTCYRIKWYDSWVMNDSLPNEWQHLVDDFWKKTTDQQQQQQHQQDIPPLDSVIENAINQKQENNLILTKLPTFSSLLSGSTDIQPGFLSPPAVDSLSVLQPQLEEPSTQQHIFQQDQPLSSFVAPSQQQHNILTLPVNSLSAEENQLLQPNELINVTSNFQLSIFSPATTQNDFQILTKEALTEPQQDTVPQQDTTMVLSSNDLNQSVTVPEPIPTTTVGSQTRNDASTNTVKNNTNNNSRSKRKIVRKIASDTTTESKNGNDTSCNECNRDFSKTLNPKKRLREHVRRVHLKNGKFQCSDCPKSFVCRQGLRDHEPVHSKERNHACTYCGKTFLRLSHLYIHTRTHEEEKNFRCEGCFFTFNVQSELKDHCEKNHSDISINIKCSVCKQNLFSSQSIYSHSLRHSGTRDWKCDVCGSAFKRKQILDQHKKRHLEDSNQHKKSICEQCSKEFPTSSALGEHISIDHHTSSSNLMSSVSDNKACDGNKCNVCSKVFKNVDNYMEHVKSHSKIQEMESIAKEQEQELNQQQQQKEANNTGLDVSGKLPLEKVNNVTKTDLSQHQQNTNKSVRKLNNNNSSNNTFCSVCNRSFTCTGYLKKHMEMHGTTELKCDVCLMIFKRRDTLRIHKKRHLQRNETMENFKGMKGEISNRRKALYANIGEPDEDGYIPCPYCYKKFNKRKLLLAHIVIHSDVSFPCEVCGKSYKQRNCLNKHKQSHLQDITATKNKERPQTGVKPRTKGKYKCTVCTLNFTSIKMLSEHEVFHKTLRIDCQNCELAFLSKDDFELHIKQTHTINTRRNSSPKAVDTESIDVVIDCKL